MKVGVNVTSYNHPDWERLFADDFSRPPTTPDYQFMDEAIAFGDLIEPLGFDSIWSTEHFGSAYSMQPNILQFLAFWAGRTQRVDLGTGVIVVPWWNPIRLAHEMSMLDILLKGRRLHVGLGRGIAESEYAALGVSRDNAREIFYETLEVLRLADTQERFSYKGKFWDIPPTCIRPQARHRGHLLEDVKVAVLTRRSMELAGEAGLGLLFTANESLEAMSKQIREFNEIRSEHGFGPDRPGTTLFTYCAADEAGIERGRKYFAEQMQASVNHYYTWGSTGFDGIAGYEEYADKLSRGTNVPKEMVDSDGTSLIGTPDQLIENIKRIHDEVNLGYLVIHMNYGGMPIEEATDSLRLFAKEVLPAVREIPDGDEATSSTEAE